MEMIDHRQDANGKHLIYCMPSHPNLISISPKKLTIILLTRFFLIIEIGRKCRAVSNITPR
jgi:hypothetical protein